MDDDVDALCLGLLEAAERAGWLWPTLILPEQEMAFPLSLLGERTQRSRVVAKAVHGLNPRLYLLLLAEEHVCLSKMRGRALRAHTLGGSGRASARYAWASLETREPH